MPTSSPGASRPGASNNSSPHLRRRSPMRPASTTFSKSHPPSPPAQAPSLPGNPDVPPFDSLNADDLRSLRRNLRLAFLQIGPSGPHVHRVLSRQEILAEVRQLTATREKRSVWLSASPYPAPSHPHRSRAPARSPVPTPRRRTRGTPHTHGVARDARSRARTGLFETGHMLPLSPPTAPSLGNRLTVRDMRQVDPSFTARPAIWVREEALVVSLETVRAIILSDRMFLFDPDNAKVLASLSHIKRCLANNIDDAFMPFEFRALEGILIHACLVLETDFTAIDPELRRTLVNLPQQVSNEQLERLRQLELQLNHYYARVRKVQHALQDILDEDEDMSEMYLTEKRKNPGLIRNPLDHDEAEMLLETYLQTVDDLTSRAGLLNQAIDDTENLIEIHLDTMQNRVLLVDLIITAISTTLSFGTLVTAIFGMNLPLPSYLSELPSSHYYFWGLVCLTLLTMGVGLWFLTRWCRKQGLYYSRPSGHIRRRSRNASNSAAPNERKVENGDEERGGYSYSRRSSIDIINRSKV